MYYDKFNFEFKFSKRRQIKKIKISNLYILAEIDACPGIFISGSLKEFKPYKDKIVVIKGK